MKPSTKVLIWPAGIFTIQQVKQVQGELENLRNWQKDYNRSVKAGAITSSPRPAFSPDAQLIAGADTQKLSAETIDKLIDNVETAASQSPVVHVTLPLLPGEDVRRDLTTWFRNNVSPNSLLDFVADTSLGGGIIVRTKNHIYNFSLSRQLWEQRQLIPDILRRV